LAKPNYQHEKRQKDLAKKKKQDEKRQRKTAKKVSPPQTVPPTRESKTPSLPAALSMR
jgi:hypothetical protein